MARVWADFANVNQDTTTTPGDLKMAGGATITNWLSPLIDTSQVLDKTSGLVTYNKSAGGQVTVKARTTNDGVVWLNTWTDVLADGTITLVTGDKLQLAVNLTAGASVQDLTVNYDGLPVATLLIGTMSAQADYDFAVFRDLAIIVNKKDADKKWDGVAAVADLGGTPPIFSFVEVHKNRVWGVEADSSRVRFSDILNAESWPALNFIDLNPDDGDKLTVIKKYGDSLFCSKMDSVALIVGDKTTNFAVTWLDIEQGVMSFKGLDATDKLIAYVARDGVRFTDLNRSTLASERLQPTWDTLINHRRLDQAAMIYWQHYLLVALPGTGSLHNNTVWVLDLLRNAWAIILGWSVSSWVKFRQYGGEVLLAGDAATGQIYEVLLSSSQDDGVAVELEWETKQLDFGFPERYKLFSGHVIVVEGQDYATVLNVTYKVAGSIDANGNIVDQETDFVVPAINIAAGKGQEHVVRLIPPVYNAVLGRTLSVHIKTGASIHSQAIDFVVKGVVSGGLV